MRVNRAGRAVDDVRAAVVGLPTSESSGREVLVGVGDAVVVLGPVGVGCGARGVAALPELLDEVVTLCVASELQEGRTLLRRDEPADVLIEPGLVLGGDRRCAWGFVGGLRAGGGIRSVGYERVGSTDVVSC